MILHLQILNFVSELVLWPGGEELMSKCVQMNTFLGHIINSQIDLSLVVFLG